MAKAPKEARRKAGKEKPDGLAGLPPLNLNAAGIDVGQAEHTGAVPPGQSFGSFTADVHRLGKWLNRLRKNSGFLFSDLPLSRSSAVLG